jgi:hypothetical protein
MYEGGGGGFSVTIHPQEIFDSAASWLMANPEFWC